MDLADLKIEKIKILLLRTLKKKIKQKEMNNYAHITVQ